MLSKTVQYHGDSSVPHFSSTLFYNPDGLKNIVRLEINRVISQKDHCKETAKFMLRRHGRIVSNNTF